MTQAAPQAAAKGPPSGATKAASLARRKPDTLVKLLALIILTYIWRVQDMIGPLSKIKFPTMVILLVLWTYFTDVKAIRRYRHVSSPILTMLFIWGVLIAAGIPSSILPGASFEFLIKDFIPDVIMALVLAASVRGLRDLEWLLGVHVAGAMVYNLYALIFFDVDGTGRLGGMLYYDANDFSQTIVCTLPVVMYFLRGGAPSWQRKLALFAFPVLIVNFVRAGSRGGFLGFAAIALISLFGYSPIKATKRFAAVALMLAGISAVGGDQFWAKMKTILKPQDDYNMQSDTGRWQLWKNALSIVRQRPILGVGARQYSEANAEISDLARSRIESGLGMIPWERAHNAYVSVAAEIGVPAFLVFVSLLLTSLALSIALTMRAGRLSDGAELSAMARMLAITIVGYMVSAFFLTAEYQAVLYLNFGFLLAVRKLVNTMTVPKKAKTSARRVRRRAFPVPTPVPTPQGATAAVRA